MASALDGMRGTQKRGFPATPVLPSVCCTIEPITPFGGTGVDGNAVQGVIGSQAHYPL